MSGTHLALSYGNTLEITLRKILHIVWGFFLFYIILTYNINMDFKKLLVRLASLIFFIFLLNYLAMKFHWYSSIWYLDMPMHFLGGVWLGLIFIWFFRLKEIDIKIILEIIFCVLFVGILWEYFEYIVNIYTTQNNFNILDTTSDILFDLSGGLFSIFYFLRYIMYIKENTI